MKYLQHMPPTHIWYVRTLTSIQHTCLVSGKKDLSWLLRFPPLEGPVSGVGAVWLMRCLSVWGASLCIFVWCDCWFCGWFPKKPSTLSGWCFRVETATGLVRVSVSPPRARAAKKSQNSYAASRRRVPWQANGFDVEFLKASRSWACKEMVGGIWARR